MVGMVCGGSMGVRGGSNDGLGGVNGMTAVFYDRVKAVMVIGGVVYGTSATVGLDQRVRALYDITITLFVLVLYVTSVLVGYAVVEVVLGVRIRVDLLVGWAVSVGNWGGIFSYNWGMGVSGSMGVSRGMGVRGTMSVRIWGPMLAHATVASGVTVVSLGQLEDARLGGRD